MTKTYDTLEAWADKHAGRSYVVSRDKDGAFFVTLRGEGKRPGETKTAMSFGDTLGTAFSAAHSLYLADC